MKGLTLRMTLVFAILLAVTMIGSASAVTLYVNGQAGNDSWDGKAREFQGGTTGPKETINAAIFVASSTGDVIEVNYANGLAYNIVDPSLLSPNPPTHMAKQITFTSYGGTPTVNSWVITANTTFTGNFFIGQKLWLKGRTGGDCQRR